MRKKSKPHHARLKTEIRRIWWRYSPARKEALRRAKLPRRGAGWLCAECLGVTMKPEVDHIAPVGSAPGSRGSCPLTGWDAYIRRMECSVDGLRVLCHDCHQALTEKPLRTPRAFA